MSPAVELVLSDVGCGSPEGQLILPSATCPATILTHFSFLGCWPRIPTWSISSFNSFSLTYYVSIDFLILSPPCLWARRRRDGEEWRGRLFATNPKVQFQFLSVLLWVPHGSPHCGPDEPALGLRSPFGVGQGLGRNEGWQVLQCTASFSIAGPARRPLGIHITVSPLPLPDT